MTDKSKDDPDYIRKNLEKIEKAGIRLYLDGAPASPEYIAISCVKEDTVYMPDYVMDENGLIKEIRYDKVSHQ